MQPRKAPSWSSGGTAGELDRERKQASFDVDKMMVTLDGSKKNRQKRQWIVDSTEKLTGPMVQVQKYDMERTAMIAEGFKNFMTVG